VVRLTSRAHKRSRTVDAAVLLMLNVLMARLGIASGSGHGRRAVASAVVDVDAAMGLALDEAAAAVGHGDVPVGAVVLRDGEVIAQRHNEREHTGDPTAHAEVLALRDAADVAGTWRLEGTTLVVTLEPCPMCAGALVNARVGRLIYGARDPKMGCVHTLYELCTDPRFNHRLQVVPDVLADECGALLSDFFRTMRGRDRPAKPRPAVERGP
jgi:tRNA(adenine34) deaminase